MANVFVRSGFFLSERKKLQELNSRLLLSSIDFIDASLWLLAGNRLPQALVMLHNAIEVALKGELERIHKILIANTKELSDFRALKSLLRDAFMKHPSGSGVEIPEFDIEKTIYFEEAFDRVAELYPGLSERWRQQLISSKGKKNKHSLHSLRNDIVHYGGDPDSMGRYTEAIVDIAFPFIEEFLKLASEDKVSLAHLVKEWIYREVEVARLVLRDLRNEKTPPHPYAIRTLQHHMLWTHAGWPSPLDDQDTVTWSGETEWEKYLERQKRELFKTWDEDFTVEIDCPVCDSQPSDGSFAKAQVLLERSPVNENRLVAEGFNCFVCGLLILPEERFLARHFVGELPEEITTAYLKDPPR
jgi:hypothetical protein